MPNEISLCRQDAERVLSWFNPYSANTDEDRAADEALAGRLRRYIDLDDALADQIATLMPPPHGNWEADHDPDRLARDIIALVRKTDSTGVKLNEMRDRAEMLRRDVNDATYRHNRDPKPFQLADMIGDLLALVEALIERQVTAEEDRP